MTKPRRDPAEWAALVEQGVARGMDAVDAVLAAAGRGNRAASTSLAAEHRKAIAANRREVARHRTRVGTLRTEVTGGAVVAGIGGSIGLIDVLAGPGGSPLLWFAAGAVGLAVSVRARIKLRRVGPGPGTVTVVGPPPALPRAAIGAGEVARLATVRVQVLNMAPALDRLYPGSGAELRRADQEAAGPLTALAERLGVLDKLRRDLPGTEAAKTAAASAEVVRVRLAEGCSTYDDLLAAAAQLLAAPDLSRSTSAILAPAVDAMLAYAHGLQTASDL